MNSNERAKALLIMIGLMMSIVFLGPVSADSEPNNGPMDAELVTKGTYTGSLEYTLGDENDWYRVDDIGDRTVKVSVKILNDQGSVSVDSYDSGGMVPDTQVEGEI